MDDVNVVDVPSSIEDKLDEAEIELLGRLGVVSGCLKEIRMITTEVYSMYDSIDFVSAIGWSDDTEEDKEYMRGVIAKHNNKIKLHQRNALSANSGAKSTMKEVMIDPRVHPRFNDTLENRLESLKMAMTKINRMCGQCVEIESKYSRWVDLRFPGEFN